MLKNNNPLLDILRQKRKNAYNVSGSVLKEYHDFLLSKGIYPSLHQEEILKKLKGRKDLCDELLRLYRKSTVENERIVFLENLQVMGYNKNKLVELILEVFYSESRPKNLWEYADLLYSIKNFNYLTQYLEIIQDVSYGVDRQMIVLLVGKSRDEKTIPILKTLLDDNVVYGHALDALSNFSGNGIEQVMYEYIDCEVTWVKEIAKAYIVKHC